MRLCQRGSMAVVTSLCESFYSALCCRMGFGRWDQEKSCFEMRHRVMVLSFDPARGYLRFHLRNSSYVIQELVGLIDPFYLITKCY